MHDDDYDDNDDDDSLLCITHSRSDTTRQRCQMQSLLWFK